jgi:hypothetical protein
MLNALGRGRDKPFISLTQVHATAADAPSDGANLCRFGAIHAFLIAGPINFSGFA